jgi:hypothetical protein
LDLGGQKEKMNNEIVKKTLGVKALDYLKERLKWGITFSKIVLEKIDLAHGEPYVYIPNYISMSDILEFNCGGKLEPEKTWRFKKEGICVETIPHLFGPYEEEVNRHLKQSPNNVCLLEDLDSSPTDPILDSLKEENYIFVDDEVYLFLQPVHAETERVQRTLRLVPSFGIFNFFLTSFPPGESKELNRFEFVSKDLIHEFAARTEKIFTSAYDGESFVFWQRKQP